MKFITLVAEVILNVANKLIMLDVNLMLSLFKHVVPKANATDHF